MSALGLDSEAYSSHFLRASFITQAIWAGKAERRIQEHSDHADWELFNWYIEEAGTFQDNPPEDSWSLKNLWLWQASGRETGRGLNQEDVRKISTRATATLPPSSL